MVIKEWRDEVKGREDKKCKWKGYWKRKKTEEKVNRRCGRGSQNNLIFKMEESQQLAVSSDV